MRRDASTRPTRSINHFGPRGKLPRSRTPQHPSADYWQDRSAKGRIRRGEQFSTESQLLCTKTDCVEGDFVLPIEIRCELNVSDTLLKLVQIGDVVLEHAVFGRMREVNVIRIRRQRRERLIKSPKRFCQLRRIGEKHQLFVKSPIQTDDC